MTGADAPLRRSARPAGALPAGFTGLGRRRCWPARPAGRRAAAARGGARPARGLDFAVPVLLVLVLVVAAALLGGLRVALPGAVAGALVLNWFLTPPYGTLVVESAEQVVVLAVYLGVAVAVSWVVDVAARRTAEAAARPRRGRGAVRPGRGRPGRAPDRCATCWPRSGRCSACARPPCSSGPTARWAVVEVSGDEPRRAPDERELRVPAGSDLLLRVRGPELFAADRRVLASFADAAAGALHGRAGWPSGPPRPRSWRRPTGCAPPCSPVSDTTCAPRWRRSRRR